MTDVFVSGGGFRALLVCWFLVPSWLCACGEDVLAMPVGPERGLVAGAVSHDAAAPQEGDAAESKEVDAAVADASVRDTAVPASAAKGFAAVYPLFAERCAPCHTEAAAGWLGFDSERIAYRELVGSLATEVCHDGPKHRVVPGDPEGSVLMQRLSGDRCGELMPPGGPALDAADLELVRRWIDDGALRD